MLKLLFSKSNPEKGTDSCPPITGSINSGKFKPIFIADKKRLVGMVSGVPSMIYSQVSERVLSGLLNAVTSQVKNGLSRDCQGGNQQPSG